MEILKKYSRLSSLEKRMYFIALLLLIWVRLIILICPFRWYTKWLGMKDKETPEESNEHKEYVFLVKDTIRRVARYNLFDAKCLAETIVAKRFLNKKSIPSTLYLGVAKNEKQKMIAHAWLRCGDVIVTGKKGMGRFTVVSKFG